MPEPADVAWLDPDERAMWVVVAALTSLVPAVTGAQLQRDAGLRVFEYGVLAVLSERDDRTMAMSELASVAGGSLSRLSHLAGRMERRGYLVRSALSGDGRVTVATLTDAGYAAVVAAAPAHVAEVRHRVVDPVPAAEREVVVTAGLRIIEAIDPGAAASLRHSLGLDATRGREAGASGAEVRRP